MQLISMISKDDKLVKIWRLADNAFVSELKKITRKNFKMLSKKTSNNLKSAVKQAEAWVGF